MSQFNNPYDDPTYPAFGQLVAPPPAPRRSYWQKYQALSRKGKIGFGCVSLIILMTLCSCISGISAAAQNGLGAIAPTATVNTNISQVAHNPSQNPTTTHPVQTPIPTHQPIPTPTPRPTPTKAPAPTPRPVPTQAPTPQPTCQAVNGNPWCYNFESGNLIYNPPSNFCGYFNCIASFWNGSGYVDECVDQTYSKSGGRSGACSHHGGEMRPLYSH